MFVGVGNGLIQRRHPDGTLNATLDKGLGGFTTGMAFDKLGNLHSTAFSANTIVTFDATGAKIGGVPPPGRTSATSYSSRGTN